MHCRVTCFSFLCLFVDFCSFVLYGHFFLDSSPVLGKVIIAVNHTLSDLSMVEINYRAHVLHGGVAYDWGQISFQVQTHRSGIKGCVSWWCVYEGFVKLCLSYSYRDFSS